MEEINKFIKGKEIYIVLIIAAIVGHYLLRNRIGKGIKKAGEWFKPDIKDIDPKTADWINDQISLSEPPTIGNETAYRYANIIIESVAGWGTDENAVYDVLKNLRNKSDFLMVMKLFGTVEGKDLIQMFQSDEFNLDERLYINSLMNKLGLSIKVN